MQVTESKHTTHIHVLTVSQIQLAVVVCQCLTQPRHNKVTHSSVQIWQCNISILSVLVGISALTNLREKSLLHQLYQQKL